jgi:hypothetical protein
LFVMAACQNAQSEDTSAKPDQSSNQEAMDFQPKTASYYCV